MKIEDVKKVILPDDLDEVMDELDQVDGLFDAIVIYDSELVAVLREMQIVSQNSRGGCAAGPLHKEFYKLDLEEIVQKIVEFCKARGITVKREVITVSYVDLC